MIDLSSVLASSNLPLLLAFLTLLMYLLFRPSQDGYRDWEAHEAFHDLTLTLMLVLSSFAATLSLAQALLTENVLYALLAVAIGGLLALVGRWPRRGFED